MHLLRCQLCFGSVLHTGAISCGRKYCLRDGRHQRLSAAQERYIPLQKQCASGPPLTERLQSSVIESTCCFIR